MPSGRWESLENLPGVTFPSDSDAFELFGFAVHGNDYNTKVELNNQLNVYLGPGQERGQPELRNFMPRRNLYVLPGSISVVLRFSKILPLCRRLERSREFVEQRSGAHF